MKNWFRQHWLAFKRTLGGMLRQPLTSLLNLLVIAVAAAFPLALWLVISSLSGVAGRMPVESQITVFLRSSATEGEIKALRELDGKDARIARHRFVSRDEALKEMQQSTGMGDLLAGLPDNPLPDAIIFTAKSNQAETLETLQKELAVKAGVDEAQLDSAWARRLERLLALGRAVFDAIAVLLALALVLITGNTIRMQILTRQDEIEVSKLIGASDAFIRRPFIHFAIAQGLGGGLLACGIVALALWRLNPAVRELATAYGQQFALTTPGLVSIALVCAATTLLCLFGAWLAVWQHLRKLL
ncbi:cell division transport system permease protein [Formivibrio citricus]|uniref:Cell division protein FtsX n=1 Tax=Formivibrio citricus TaxID=83765 RepID=A0A1I4VLL3_9NEIS|nr:permease-like cell division protein FtsX [Formivibrio citricus]SFN02009.1 cell division transport system permease protein [Formivibrio citricus]